MHPPLASSHHWQLVNLGIIPYHTHWCVCTCVYGCVCVRVSLVTPYITQIASICILNNDFACLPACLMLLASICLYMCACAHVWKMRERDETR